MCKTIADHVNKKISWESQCLYFLLQRLTEFENMDDVSRVHESIKQMMLTPETPSKTTTTTSAPQPLSSQRGHEDDTIAQALLQSIPPPEEASVPAVMAKKQRRPLSVVKDTDWPPPDPSQFTKADDLFKVRS